MGEQCSKHACVGCEPLGTTMEFKSGMRLRAVGGPSLDVLDDAGVGQFDQEPELTWRRFSIARNMGWRGLYRRGRELGTGQSAVAYEAFATALRDDASSCSSCSPPDSDQEPPEQTVCSRRVVLKVFRAQGSVAFRQELKVMSWLGPHPHVARLLEAFEGHCDDALVLEHCELGDVYEYYVRRGARVREEHSAELLRQLLLALHHLVNRRVQHRDVKPENLLLYRPHDRYDVPLLKLADYGWATISLLQAKPLGIPSTGVGSLLYAPPELNPPVPGVEPQDPDAAPLGSCDMWSVGVIAYLLMAGHSPFDAALAIKDDLAREAEVLRRVALGAANYDCPYWLRLAPDVQEFCRALLRPRPQERPSANLAMDRGFIKRAVRYAAVAEVSGRPRAEGRACWDGLDGLQRLAWLAVAFAVSEPEVLEARCMGAPVVLARADPLDARGGYLEDFARELSATAAPTLLRPRAPWDTVVGLAFRYLDFNGDGRLSAHDLAQHIMSSNASMVAHLWLARWSTQDAFGLSDFRRVLGCGGGAEAIDAPAAAGARFRHEEGPPVFALDPARALPLGLEVVGGEGHIL